MTINLLSLIFIWLLSLTAVTSGQDDSFMTATTGTQFTAKQLTTQEASTLNPLSEVSGGDITQSIRADEKASTKPLLQTTATPSTTFLTGIQTAAAPNDSTWFQLNSSTPGMTTGTTTTEVQFQGTTSAVMVGTSHASITTTKVPLMLSGSTQSHFTSDQITHPSTNHTPTTTTSTKPVENKSTSTSHVTHGDASQSTGFYRMATTRTPFIHITKAKKRQDPPEKESTKSTSHSWTVAGLIGGALVLMMVGFLLIYIKKRKLQRQQITTTDWAGPSPFLEGGADNGQVTLRSSNRISLSSFLPQSLTKRLSLLPETDEELEDMTPGTTFGNKCQENTFGQEVNGNDGQESDGTTVVVSEMTSTGDAPETTENSVSGISSQTGGPLCTNNNSEVENRIQDHSATPPPTPSGAMENAPTQLNDGT